MPVPISNIAYENSVITPIGQVREHAMNDEMVQSLREMYEVLFHGCTIVHTMSLCQRFVRVKVGNNLYSSKFTETVLLALIGLRMILDQLIPHVFAVLITSSSTMFNYNETMSNSQNSCT